MLELPVEAGVDTEEVPEVVPEVVPELVVPGAEVSEEVEAPVTQESLAEEIVSVQTKYYIV